MTIPITKKIKVNPSLKHGCSEAVCGHKDSEDDKDMRKVWTDNHLQILDRSSAILLAQAEAGVEEVAAELLGDK